MPLSQPRWSLLVEALALALVLEALGGCTSLRETASQQPTPFTELYFAHPGSLPKQLPTGRPSQFEFTIVNHEKKATTYHYVVSGDTASTSQPLAAGDATLLVGAARSVPVTFVPSLPGADYVVTVRMANRGETLHFTTRS